MEFAEALHEWSEFFLLLGTVSGAFVALVFVAISVGIGFFTERNLVGTRYFTSPVVLHFSTVMFVSALAMAPTHVPWLFVGVLGATGLIGIGLVNTVSIIRYEQKAGVTLFDYFAYGAVPAVCLYGHRPRHRPVCDQMAMGAGTAGGRALAVAAHQYPQHARPHADGSAPLGSSRQATVS
jgi:hypothetical protein